MSGQVTPTKRRLSSTSELLSPVSKLELVQGENINTFMFLKCNVTNINNPKLTELAMIAVSKVDLLRNGSGDGLMADCNLRYKDSLVLSFDPLAPIHAQDGANSRLTSELLVETKRKSFDIDAVHAINNFLQKQSRPVCLLAHNGTSVDFKVLRKEFETLGMTICGGQGIKLFCADTLWVFHGLDHNVNEIGDGVRRMLFAEPFGSGPQKTEVQSSQVSPKQVVQPTMLDYARYSFENVYRRYCDRFPDPNARNAKYYAQCLLEIFRKIPENPLHVIPCRNFSHLTSNDTSPSKLSKKESSLLNHSGPLTTRNNEAQDGAIETYVFLDLETTGLDTDVCGIAELCMIAVHRSQLGRIVGEEQNNLDNIIPNVMDECSFMIRPLDDFSNEASRINGLTTEGFDTRGISCFTRRITGLLEDFLNRQAKPICLVAHNGNRFDFPILDVHLKRAQTQHQIWREILCADTYLGIRELVERDSYALNAIYRDLLGGLGVHPPAHTAEGDVLRMISIVKMLPENLLQWMDGSEQHFCPN